MFNPACSSQKLSCLALLCVCALLFAWAAPVLLSGALPDFLQHSQGQSASAPADASSEFEDTSDDPILFLAHGQPGLLPVMFALQSDQVLAEAWSPTAPVRPPNSLNSI